MTKCFLDDVPAPVVGGFEVVEDVRANALVCDVLFNKRRTVWGSVMGANGSSGSGGCGGTMSSSRSMFKGAGKSSSDSDSDGGGGGEPFEFLRCRIAAVLLL